MGTELDDPPSPPATTGAAAAGSGVPVLALVAGLVGLVGLAAAGAASLAVGQGEIPLAQVVDALLHPETGGVAHTTVFEIRIPRTLLAVLVGAALGVAGALIQTMTRNPLAEPGLLGVNAGAALAVVLATVLLTDVSMTTQLIVASAGAGLTTLTVYAVGRDNPLRLVLAGVALTMVLSGVALAIRLLDSEAFDDYRFWSVGTLAGREQIPLLLPAAVIIAALALALLLGRPLGALALGDDVAAALGVPVVVVRMLTVATLTVLAGAATAVAGPIAFAGLMVPHIARRFSAASVPWLLGLSIVFGAVLLTVADVVSRLVLPTGDVPVAIVTAFIGGPVLILVARAEVFGS